MFHRTSLALGILLFPLLAATTPSVQRRQSITTLSPEQIASYKPYTFYAGAAACNPSTIMTWTCGSKCDANPGFIPIAVGGDGGAVQFWYVGFDPKLNTIIVGHQGTDPTKLLADLTDINFLLLPLNPTLFPGVPSSVLVHSGFANEQAQTAAPVLAAVKQAMSQFGTNKVAIVGHSLGAALALMDAVYLPLHLPADTEFECIVYGLPRVGNKAFADWVDGHDHLTHINNKRDPVPTYPFQILGYVHPAGEIHIRADNSWVACPGQDNPSSECEHGTVPNILLGDLGDHGGPYDGVPMGC